MVILLSQHSFHDSIALVESENKSHTQYYGCVQYISSTHCDPIHNNMSAFRYPSTSLKVYELSDSYPFFVQGKFGQALEMRAPYREAIHFPKLSNITFNDFSVAFWVKTTEELEPSGNIISYTDSANTAGWFFDMSAVNNTNATIRFVITENEGKPVSSPDVHVAPDNFHFIVGTFNGTYVKIYSDGSLVGQTKYVGNYTGSPRLPLSIGSSSYCASCNRWTGIIDDLKIYDKALDSEQVHNLFTNSINPESVGLVAYAKFDGNFNDSSGNGNTGTESTLLASMAYAPDGRLFFSEKNTGLIRIIQNSKVLPEPFVRIVDHFVNWEQGLLGITIDPKFIQNHFVYLYYTTLDKNTGDVYGRVVRFTEKDGKAIDRTVLLDKIFAEKGYHAGGALAFGPDDKLYITVGDATEHPFAQDTSVLIGKILRINRDGTIPPDNPIPNSPVFTFGHRNMYGIAFDAFGNGLVSENGDYYYDEVNLIKKGGNYGFPLQQPANLPPELSNYSGSILPLRTYWDTIAPTQMIYYKGDKIPLLKDKFLLGTYQGDIYALYLDPKTKEITEEDKIDLENYPFKPVIGITQAPNGDVYFGAYNIWKLNGTDLSSKKQYLFPIEFNTTSLTSVVGVDFKVAENKMVIDIRNSANSERISPVKIKIPTALLHNIATVVDASNNKPISFTNSTNSAYNFLDIRIPPKPQLQIGILGSSLSAPGEQILEG
jgi:glucose/arabinose dehydrogenase